MPEPRVILLGGNRGRWSAKEKASEASTMNGIEAWVYAFDGDYIEGATAQSKDLTGYDIIIADYNFSKAKHILELAQKRDQASKWVTLIEGDALDYLKPQEYMREVMDSSDLIGCINKYSKSFFTRLTTARVECIGIPYPVEGIRALATPIEERRKEIFLAPMLLSRWLEYFCAKDLGVPLYGHELRLTRQRRTILKTIRKHRSVDPWYFHKKVLSLYSDQSLMIYKEQTLSDFFHRSGGAYIWLNLDQRYTWGRYVLDAAALQVPIVTTRSTGHAETFFPKTMVENEFDLENAAELVKKLLKDEDFYRSVATIPIEKFDHLRPDRKKKELIELLYSS